MQLSPSDLLLLKSSKIHLSVAEMEQLDALLPQISNWEEAAVKLIERGGGPLFYKKIPQLSHASLIPAGVNEKLRQSYLMTLGRSMQLYDAFGKVASALKDAGIKVVALKGIYLAEHLYGDIGLRQMSDIDLLINEFDSQRAISVLNNLGYKSTGERVSDLIRSKMGIIHLPAMVSKGVAVELHINLHGKRENYKIETKEILERSIPVRIYGSDIFVPEINDLIIFLCIHLDKHFKSGDVQHRNFADILNLALKNENQLNWKVLISRCESYHCEQEVFRYLLLINRFYGLLLPDNVLNRYKSLLTDELINQFIVSLHETGSKPYGTKAHLQNLQSTSGFLPKLKYFFTVLFPPREFMLKSYPVKNPSMYMLWYPYRLWKGLKGLMRMKK